MNPSFDDRIKNLVEAQAPPIELDDITGSVAAGNVTDGSADSSASGSRRRHALQLAAAVLVLAVGGGALVVQLQSEDPVVATDDPTKGSDPAPATSIPEGTLCPESELAAGRRWPLDESGEEIEMDPAVFSETQRARVVEAFQSSSQPDLSNLVEASLEDVAEDDREAERALSMQLIPRPTADTTVGLTAYPTKGTPCETAGSMTEGDPSWNTVLRHEGGLIVGLQQKAQLQKIVVGSTYSFSVVVDNDLPMPMEPPYDASPTDVTREVERIARELNDLPDEPDRASSPSDDPAGDATSEVTIAVANASGLSGVAGMVTDDLNAAGYPNVTALNAEADQSTKVYFYPGSETDAMAVAKVVGIPETAVEERPPVVKMEEPGKGAQIIVVLGNDFGADYANGATQLDPADVSGEQPVAFAREERAAVVAAFAASSDPQLAQLDESEPDTGLPAAFQASLVALDHDKRFVQVTKLVESPEEAIVANTRNTPAATVKQDGLVKATWDTTGQSMFVVATDSFLVQEEVVIIDGSTSTRTPASPDNLDSLAAVAQKIEAELGQSE